MPDEEELKKLIQQNRIIFELNQQDENELNRKCSVLAIYYFR